MSDFVLGEGGTTVLLYVSPLSIFLIVFVGLFSYRESLSQTEVERSMSTRSEMAKRSLVTYSFVDILSCRMLSESECFSFLLNSPRLALRYIFE